MPARPWGSGAGVGPCAGLYGKERKVGAKGGGLGASSRRFPSLPREKKNEGGPDIP